MAGVAEIGTFPAINYIDSWWSSYPRDERLSSVSYVQYNSTASIDNTRDFLFTLPPTDPPTLYDLSDILLKVQVRIVTSKGNTPSKGKYKYIVFSKLLPTKSCKSTPKFLPKFCQNFANTTFLPI